MEKFKELLTSNIETETFIQCVFGSVRKKSDPCRKVSIKPVILRGDYQYQAEFHFEKKVTHENLSKEACLTLCLKLLQDSFKQVNLFTLSGDYQILASKPELPKIIRKNPTKTMGDLSHNREKQYLIPDGSPCDFLIRLGVMNPEGQVIPKHYNKFRQINRFLEIVEDVLGYLPNKQLKIIDFGCGKAYLTFALYYYLKIKLSREVSIVGLDLKEDVIDFCNQIARDLHYDSLKFERGDIADYDETARADMVVTLHACDTATDFALMKAVAWNASVILSVPCCQHELFDQIQNDRNAALLKQGILKERISAILTDGLRALKLEECGYQVSMIEFTSLEHTAKNIMLRCVSPLSQRLPRPSELQAMKNAGEEYRRLSAYWNVSPTIGKLIPPKI